jgi:hypothetical protein
MRLLGKFGVVTVGLAAVLAMAPAKADAAVLTITDTFGGSNTVWTLNIATGCTTCAATLTAAFQDPAGPATNGYTGTFLDSVQWMINGSTITNTGFMATNALDATTTSWTFNASTSLNANQCGGGAAQGTCGETNDALGFGPIVNGSTLTWTFNTTFSSALPTTLGNGNIRAAFNNADGSNFNIFSPGGGTFGGGGSSGGGGQTVPEPASMALFGLAALAAARRARRS